MARVLGLVFSVCLLATVAGCGGGSTSATNPNQADCFDFVENFLCPTLDYCHATYASAGYGSCVDFFENAPMSQGDFIQCSTVTQEYPGLAHCESVVNNSYCAELVDAAGYATLPPACSGIFN